MSIMSIIALVAGLSAIVFFFIGRFYQKVMTLKVSIRVPIRVSSMRTGVAVDGGISTDVNSLRRRMLDAMESYQRRVLEDSEYNKHKLLYIDFKELHSLFDFMNFIVMSLREIDIEQDRMLKDLNDDLERLNKMVHEETDEETDDQDESSLETKEFDADKDPRAYRKELIRQARDTAWRYKVPDPGRVSSAGPGSSDKPNFNTENSEGAYVHPGGLLKVLANELEMLDKQCGDTQ